MLLSECKRCKKLIPYGKPYCSTCEPIAAQEREKRIAEARAKQNRKYNASRDPKYTRFYKSPEWRLLSAKQLQNDKYHCQWCGKIADEVDHIQEIRTPEGWARRLDPENLRSLCHDCHNKRHGRFQGKKKEIGFRRSEIAQKEKK